MLGVGCKLIACSIGRQPQQTAQQNATARYKRFEACLSAASGLKGSASTIRSTLIPPLISSPDAVRLQALNEGESDVEFPALSCSARDILCTSARRVSTYEYAALHQHEHQRLRRNCMNRRQLLSSALALPLASELAQV